MKAWRKPRTSNGDPHDDPGRAACLDLCDEEHSTIPKLATPNVPNPMAAPMIASTLGSLAVVDTGFLRKRPRAQTP